VPFVFSVIDDVWKSGILVCAENFSLMACIVYGLESKFYVGSNYNSLIIAIQVNIKGAGTREKILPRIYYNRTII
jgi:hypothetical protein